MESLQLILQTNKMQEALLLQKLEFLQIELEEGKKREEYLKSVNKSLMEALADPTENFVRVSRSLGPSNSKPPSYQPTVPARSARPETSPQQ